jgi:hypothetical protein
MHDENANIISASGPMENISVLVKFKPWSFMDCCGYFELL